MSKKCESKARAPVGGVEGKKDNNDKSFHAGDIGREGK